MDKNDKLINYRDIKHTGEGRKFTIFNGTMVSYTNGKGAYERCADAQGQMSFSDGRYITGADISRILTG